VERFAKEAVARAARVRLLLMDVDGVLTDGTIHLDDRGVETKGFNIMDGLGLTLLRRAGIALGIVTGRTSEVVSRRARELRMAHLIQGSADKRAAAEDILAAEGLGWEALAYVGDDLIDLPVLTRAGLAACPPGAATEVKAVVHHVTAAAGGRGAIREVCELILTAQGRWEEAVGRYR
jgi:3-deoxy-D-manno-octulosonate 8-phosphate phosphatase (KDO 8-P phosphatase)